MRIWLTVCFALMSSCLLAQEINIIPKPVSVQKMEGHFILAENVAITWDEESSANLSSSAAFLSSYLKQQYWPRSKKGKPAPPAVDKRILLQINNVFVPQKGGYELLINKTGVTITGHDGQGVFSGIQTLIQLLYFPNSKTEAFQTATLPLVKITDYPRFQYRGMHLDCSRHFWSVDFLKKYIDYLALHKFNTFHWHLTDDQGWRIEIKKYPKLTSVGGWRNGTIIGRYPGKGNDGIRYGGYYTQEQIKEVVKYATERYITVIPEIEMPGHASAAIAAYPELSCFPNEPTIQYYPKQCTWAGDSTGKQVQQTWGVFDDVFCAGQDKTFTFLQDVIDEILPLFPSKIIHVGGDECPKDNWKRCPSCQQRMKDQKLKDEHELQSYFIQRMEKHLNSKGRTLLGWDEILEGGLAPNAMVMSWRGEKGGIEAAQQNHDVIMTPQNPLYFDHTQSENEDSVTIGGFNPIEKVYAYEPIPAALTAEQAKHIMGAQANLWCEYIKNTRKVEYMLFPRMAALSEVLWSSKESKDWTDFEKRLQTQFKRYDFWKANYSKAYFDLKATVLPTNNYKGLRFVIKSKFKGDYNYNLHYEKTKIAITGNPGLFKFKDSVSFSILESGTVAFDLHPYLNATMVGSIRQDFHFNIATGKKITLEKPASKSYPGDGPFTLVNGIQNEKGMSKTKEFLGFSGEDCIATIDLGKEENISFVKVHYLHHPGSWIHQPSAVSIEVSTDGNNFQPVIISNPSIANNEAINEFEQPTKARYIKVHIANFGTIPAGNPGAGSKPWLFVDEIEVL